MHPQLFHAVLTMFQRRRTCDVGRMDVDGAHLVWVAVDFLSTLSEYIHIRDPREGFSKCCAFGF